MKITCISDTHFKHNYIDKRAFATTDILIHAGDFTGNGNAAQTLAFLEWFSSLDVPHKILVAGNHDFKTCSDSFPSMLAQFPSITYLLNSSVTINNLVIWGSPYSNIFGQWAYMKDDLELAEIWETIPNNTNIVITHGPAYGIGDKVINAYDRNPNVGSQSLRMRLKELKKLKLHVTGHIHESYGTYLGKYTTVNASICDINYVPFNPPISLYIE
jgi:Icc-related predicted phosphoesterase